MLFLSSDVLVVAWYQNSVDVNVIRSSWDKIEFMLIYFPSCIFPVPHVSVSKPRVLELFPRYGWCRELVVCSGVMRFFFFLSNFMHWWISRMFKMAFLKKPGSKWWPKNKHCLLVRTERNLLCSVTCGRACCHVLEKALCWNGLLTITLSHYVTHRVQVNKGIDF